MNKSGFTLIEIIIALFISSIVAVSAYQILNRTQIIVKSVNEAIESDLPIPIFYTQLERDLLGLAIAPLARMKEESTKTEISDIIQGLEKALERRTGKKIIETQANLQEIKIKDIFVSESTNENFFMSFITTGGIRLVPSGSEFKLEPLIKRVVYSLESDKNNVDRYNLIFKQSSNLDLEALKKLQGYELIDNIKSIKTNYFVYEIAKDSEEKNQNKKLIKLDSWNPKEIKEKYKTEIPVFIELEMVFIDSNNPELDYKFNFSYIIPVYFAQSESKIKSEQENIKDEDKPDTAINNKDNKKNNEVKG